MVERMTRQALIVKLADRTAASVVQALDEMACTYGERFSQIFKSITSDNGSEFAFTSQMERPIIPEEANHDLLCPSILFRRTGIQ